MIAALLIWIAAALVPSAQAAPPGPAARAFARGAELVDRNCGECMGATEAGLLEGVAALQRALELGHRDAVAAHRLLRDAYAALAFAFRGERSDPLHAVYEKRWPEEMANIVRLDPSDLPTRLTHIAFIADPAARMKALLEVAGQYPEDAAVQRALAHQCFAAGALDEGVRHGERWLALAKPRDARRQVVWLVSEVSQDGLRMILDRRPAFHPAQFRLAVLLLGKGKTAEGLRRSRAAIQAASPELATAYADEIVAVLEMRNLAAEGAALRREFADKLRRGAVSGEDG